MPTFDLTTKTKETFYNAASWALVAGGAALYATWDDPIPGEILRSAIGGGTIYLTLHGISNFTAGARQAIKSTDPYGKRYTSAFEQTVTVRTFGDLARSMLGRRAQVQPLEPSFAPPELIEFTFASQGLQLLESDVRRFLSIAHHNRARGRGLSARRWCGQNNETLPRWFKGPDWYWALLHLLADAEDVSGLRLVIVKRNGWKLLVYDNRVTYAILRHVFPASATRADINRSKQ